MADPHHFGGILDAPVISFLEAAIVHQAAPGLPTSSRRCQMVAARIGPDIRMVAVGREAYFARRPTPRTLQDLTGCTCINLRL